MSNSGRAKATGVPRNQAGGVRPASSPIRDVVTGRVDDDGSLVEVVPDNEDMTPAEGIGDDSTIRVRADRTWRPPTAAGGDPAESRRGPGPGPGATPPFANPAPPTQPAPTGAPGMCRRLQRRRMVPTPRMAPTPRMVPTPCTTPLRCLRRPRVPNPGDRLTRASRDSGSARRSTRRSGPGRPRTRSPASGLPARPTWCCAGSSPGRR